MKLLVDHDYQECAVTGHRRGRHHRRGGGGVDNRRSHHCDKDRSHSRSRSRGRSRSHSRGRRGPRKLAARHEHHHHLHHHHQRKDRHRRRCPMMDSTPPHGKCTHRDTSSSSSSSSSRSRSPTPPAKFCGRLRSHFRARNLYHWHPGHAKCHGCPRHGNKRSGEGADLVDLTTETELPVCDDVVQEVEKDGLAGGPEIDGLLAETWTEVARHGLPDDLRDSLLDKFPVSKNCPVLVGPRLDAGKPESDQTLIQHQIGSGLSALGQAMTVLNQSEELQGNKEVLGVMDTLNEAALVLLDAHHGLGKAGQTVGWRKGLKYLEKAKKKEERKLKREEIKKGKSKDEECKKCGHVSDN